MVYNDRSRGSAKIVYVVRLIMALSSIVIVSMLFSSCAIFCRWCGTIKEEHVTLLNDRGEPITSIGPFDNLRVRITDLEPHTRYVLRVVDSEGQQLAYASLAAGRRGDIPATTLLFGENIIPCGAFLQPRTATTVLSDAEPDARLVMEDTATWVRSLEMRSYYVEVLEKERVIRRAPFSFKDDGKPRLYVANRKGCPRGGLAQSRDDVYVIGRNFPAGSQVRLFLVEDQRIWNQGDRFRDISGADGAPEPEQVNLAPDQRDFFVRIWPRERTTRGLYDVIARHTDLEILEIDDQDVITANLDVGLLIQGDATGPHIEQNMTVPTSDGVLYYMFQDKYFNTDDVWVAVNPKDRPGGVTGGPQNARIYVVNHLTESQWVDGLVLNDVSTDGFDTVSIKGSCRNQNEERIWEAPLTNGNYDVVVDFAPLGVYNQGQDFIDELDYVGFQVVNPSSLAIVYPVNPVKVFPEKEVPTGPKIGYLYAVAKINPAAGGTSIYWDSLDIDDPSANTTPVDPNGASGDDNRGNYGAAPGGPDGDDGFLYGENASGIATSTTFANGIAYVRLHVTSQPGDNFKVRASTVSTLASYDESAAITVWRKLHVEIDSMGAPFGTTVAGNITNVVFNSGTNTSQVTVDINLDDGSGGTGGRFENGNLTAGGSNYPVISNTATTLTVQGNPPNGVSFVLEDDDVVPADVPDPDTGDLVRAYARAFILPVFDTGQNTGNVAFDLNTEAGERSTQINLGKGMAASTDDYWTVTVHGGFQDPTASDNDPDDEGTSRAWAVYGAGVICLEESIRDWIQAPVLKGGAGGVDPDPTCEAGRSSRRQEIVVHEVGHLLSLSHADGSLTTADPCGGVMQPSCCPAGSPGTRRSSNFTQKSLDKLRRIAKPY